MELRETIDMMLSEDYRERFKVEYYQTKIRYEKLKDLIREIEAAETLASEADGYGDPDKQLDAIIAMPKYSCPKSLLIRQEAAMRKYIRCLEIRAKIEKIKF